MSQNCTSSRLPVLCAAAAVFVTVSAAAGASAGSVEGGSVPSEVTITRLGRAVPSGPPSHGGGGTHFEKLSSAPIVLWSERGAPAVLTSSLSVSGVFMVGGVGTQKLSVLSPGPGFERPHLVPSEDASDQVLIVHTRPRQDRKLTHTETLAAAERFLPETETADLRALVRPARAGEENEDRFRAFDRELVERLTWPMRLPEAVTSARYRDPDAFRAWLGENDLHAKTVFTLVRGGRLAARFEVPGWHDDDERSEVRGAQVVWRSAGDAVTVVLSLKTGDTTDGRQEPARFHVVRAVP